MLRFGDQALWTPSSSSSLAQQQEENHPVMERQVTFVEYRTQNLSLSLSSGGGSSGYVDDSSDSVLCRVSLGKKNEVKDVPLSELSKGADM
jgi:hypothetical protein